MNQKLENGHIVLTADEGKFLINNASTIYGTEIILGVNDLVDNYTEKPMSEYPVEYKELTDEEQALLEQLLLRQKNTQVNE